MAQRTRRPVILVINYIIYALVAGYTVCYLYVTGYGGSMPPPGSFDNFLRDWWALITPILSAPIVLTVLTSYFMNRRKRTGER